VISAVRDAGIEHPWAHQATAAEHALDGESVVIATGTASGKSLAYLAPVLSTLLDGAEAANGRGTTALYLAPTKALAADQRRSVKELAAPLGNRIRPAVYDGDTPVEEREWVRQYANYVLTNPDMLHRGILPAHPRWSSFLRSLRYVVIDECHTYRGVFGSHVAQVLRRLRATVRIRSSCSPPPHPRNRPSPRAGSPACPCTRSRMTRPHGESWSSRCGSRR
jgi:DEAD/DEAH box helicase domain-containing protein